MTSFYLKWRWQDKKAVIVAYIYDGCTHQKGYTLEQWKHQCIESCKSIGWAYLGEATADEYINDD